MKRILCSSLCVVFLSTIVIAAENQDAEKKIKIEDNAALQYWQAISLMWQNTQLEECGGTELYGVLCQLAENHPALDDPRFARLEDDGDRAVRYLRRGAAMPRCCFGINFEDGAGLLLPHLGKINQLVRLAVWESMWRERKGNWRDACLLPVDAIQVGRHTAEGVLISALVGFAAMSNSAKRLEYIASTCPNKETLLEALGRLNAMAGNGPSYTELLSQAIVVGELKFGLAEYDRIAKAIKNASANDIKKMVEGLGAESAFFNKITAQPGGVAGWFEAAKKAHEQYMKSLAQAVLLPPKQAVVEMARLEKELKEGQGNELNQLMAPALSRSLGSAIQADATLSAARILLALRIRQLETGKLPEKLDEIAPLLGGQIPSNPFGEDLSYSVSNEGKPILTFATLDNNEPLEFGAGSTTYQTRRRKALDKIEKLLKEKSKK